MNALSILDMLPWEIIAPVIVLSLLIPTMLTVFFYLRRRFDDIWVSIGVFLLILSPVTYFYLVPDEVMGELRLPSDFVWEDNGDFYYWQRTGLTETDAIQYTIPAQEVISVVEMDPATKYAKIHDEFRNAQTGEPIEDPYGVPLSEYYMTDARVMKLSFVNLDAGHMTVPLSTSNENEVQVGWVESNGSENGAENVVLVRTMKFVEEKEINGLTVWVWQSVIYNKEVAWHGKSYLCSETFTLTVDPKTSYIIAVEREMTMSAPLAYLLDFIEINPLIKGVLLAVLKDGGPMGEAAKISYSSSDASIQAHVAEARTLGLMLDYSKIAICLPMVIVGLMLITRYVGKGYYWKKYGKFDNYRNVDASSNEDKMNNAYRDQSIVLTDDRERK